MPALGGSPLLEKETTKFDDWPLELGPHLTSVEVRKVRTFIRSYRRCFAFSLQDPRSVGGQPSHFLDTL